MKFTFKDTSQLTNFNQYSAFGETTLDTLGVTRQGIQKLKIDNEKLTMNRQDNIANYTIGNCQLAFDPLWEKYYGWTPYQYAYNSPPPNRDPKGIYRAKLSDIETSVADSPIFNDINQYNSIPQLILLQLQYQHCKRGCKPFFRMYRYLMFWNGSDV